MKHNYYDKTLKRKQQQHHLTCIGYYGFPCHHHGRWNTCYHDNRATTGCLDGDGFGNDFATVADGLSDDFNTSWMSETIQTIHKLNWLMTMKQWQVQNPMRNTFLYNSPSTIDLFLVDHFQPMLAANSFALLSVLNTVWNHCLQPTLDGRPYS